MTNFETEEEAINFIVRISEFVAMSNSCSKAPEEAKKPKWNAKIICTEAHEPYFTHGKIYEVRDGIFEDNLGEETLIFNSLEMLNDTYSAQFAEVVE